MYTADLEYCEELFELSGWRPKTGWEYTQKNEGDSWQVTPWDYGTCYASKPAFDAGFLLRKLPPLVDSKEYPGKPAYLNVGLRDDGPPWFCWYTVLGIQDVVSDFGVHADTPENALCLLTLELIKKGVLNPKGEA